MSFEIEANAKPLKQLVAAVREFAELATLEIHPDAVKLAIMDPSRSVLIHFQIPKAQFEQYTGEFGEDGKALLIPVSFEHLQQIFGEVKDEPVVFRNGEAAVQIDFPESPERHFTVPLQDPESASPETKLTTELPYQCTLDAKIFHQLVKTLVRVGTAVAFRIIPPDPILQLLTQGDGVEKAEIILRSEQFPVVEAITGPMQEMCAEYSLKWLQDIMKHAAKLGENVTLTFGDELPLALNVVLENGGELGYYLAPRIEEA